MMLHKFKAKVNKLFFLILLVFLQSKAIGQLNAYIQFSEDSIFLRQKVDSIKNDLLLDTTTSVLVIFNAAYSFSSGNGCIIKKNEKKITGVKFNLVSKLYKSNIIDKKILKRNGKLLNDFFSMPSKYTDFFFPNTVRHLSHDNMMYVLVKIRKNILLDNFFMRSSFLNTKNERAFNLILNISAM